MMAVAKKNEELSIDALKQGRVTLRISGNDSSSGNYPAIG